MWTWVDVKIIRLPFRDASIALPWRHIPVVLWVRADHSRPTSFSGMTSNMVGLPTTLHTPIRNVSDAKSQVSVFVEGLFRKAHLTGGTLTKGGWCLKEGMRHVLTTDTSGILLSVIQQKGLPAMISIVEDASCRHDEGALSLENKPQWCFESLCRIIAGQQLAGAAAKSVWNRLRSIADPLTPQSILALAEKGIDEHLRKPAGLSNAKARSIVALSGAFQSGDLSEDFLSNPATLDEEIRAKLLPIKGIGPWTCDMFLMFHLEKRSILPLGDLGVRKGIAKFFKLQGRGHHGILCDKKDKEVMEAVIAPYSPYLSLFSYYMWAVADTKNLGGDPSATSNKRKERSRTADAIATPPTVNAGYSKRARTTVTP
jgi:DNA-3-methyladenine glycosylase II